MFESGSFPEGPEPGMPVNKREKEALGSLPGEELSQAAQMIPSRGYCRV